MAFGLTAYVSRCRSPFTAQGFASQVLVRLSWAGFHPQGSYKRFFNSPHVCLSSSSKLLGTIPGILPKLPARVGEQVVGHRLRIGNADHGCVPAVSVVSSVERPLAFMRLAVIGGTFFA